MVARPEYVWERFINSPMESLWKMWTDPHLFCQWYGPNVETILHEMDVTPGGKTLIELKWNDQQSQYQKFEYQKVEPCEKLSWIQTTTDQNWTSIRPQNLALWPLRLLSTVQFEIECNKNCMHFTWSPYGAEVTNEEIAFFKQCRLELDDSWMQTIDLFTDVVNANPESNISDGH